MCSKPETELPESVAPEATVRVAEVGTTAL
jgi:hypothetical protein